MKEWKFKYHLVEIEQAIEQLLEERAKRGTYLGNEARMELNDLERIIEMALARRNR